MFLLFPHFTFLDPLFSVSLECSCCSLIYFTSLTQYFQFHSNVLAVPSFYFPWPNIFSFTRMFLLFPHFTFPDPIFSVSIECSYCSLIYFTFPDPIFSVSIECSCCSLFLLSLSNIFTGMFLLFPDQTVRTTALIVGTFILGWSPASMSFLLICSECPVPELKSKAAQMAIFSSNYIVFIIKVKINVIT